MDSRAMPHNKVEIREAAEAGEYDFAFSAPDYDPELLKWKNDDSVTSSKERLQKVSELFTEADFTSPDSIKTAIWEYAETTGRGEVLWPLRTALSGKERSPDPFTIAHIIGKEEALSRINTACDKIVG